MSMSMTPVVRLELQNSLLIFEQIRNGPNGTLRGLGELIHGINLKSKISWHCPFKSYQAVRKLPGCLISLKQFDSHEDFLGLSAEQPDFYFLYVHSAKSFSSKFLILHTMQRDNILLI